MLTAAAISATAGEPATRAQSPELLTALVVKSPRLVFAVGTSSLLESKNAGDTWATIRVPGMRTISGALFLDASRWWVASGGSGHVEVARTLDGGRTWRRTPLPGLYPDGHGIVRFAFRDSRHGWLAVPSSTAMAAPRIDLYRTTDGGATWRPLGALPFAGPIEVAGGRLWAIGGVKTQSLYASSDGGGRWRAVGVPTPRRLRKWPRTIGFLRASQGIAVEAWFRSPPDRSGFSPRNRLVVASSPDGRRWATSKLLEDRSFGTNVTGEPIPATLDPGGGWLIADGSRFFESRAGWDGFRSTDYLPILQIDLATPREGFALIGDSPPCIPFPRDCMESSIVAKTHTGGHTWHALALDGGTRSAPPCKPRQLQASAGLEGATGSELGGLTLRNTSRRGCLLPTTPPPIAILVHGKVMKMREVRIPHFPTSAELPVPIRVLEPGESANVYLRWGNWCGLPSAGAPIPIALRVQLSRYAVLDVPVTDPVTMARCDIPRAGSTIDVTAPLRPG